MRENGLDWNRTEKNRIDRVYTCSRIVYNYIVFLSCYFELETLHYIRIGNKQTKDKSTQNR